MWTGPLSAGQNERIRTRFFSASNAQNMLGAEPLSTALPYVVLREKVPLIHGWL